MHIKRFTYVAKLGRWFHCTKTVIWYCVTYQAECHKWAIDEAWDRVIQTVSHWFHQTCWHNKHGVLRDNNQRCFSKEAILPIQFESNFCGENPTWCGISLFHNCTMFPKRAKQCYTPYFRKYICTMYIQINLITCRSHSGPIWQVGL